MNNFKKLIKEALTPHYLRESVNEDFTQSSLAITDQSQVSGLDDLELLDLLNKVSYEYTPELRDSARIISQEIEDRDLTNKIHYVDNERYEFMESVYGSVGFIPSDKDAKPEHPNWRDLSAEEIQDYIDANPNTLWGRSLSRAKMVLRDKKSVNEDIQPLAVEELTDEALLDMLNNIDDMSRDKKGGTYDMSGRKMTRAQYDLAKSVEAEVRRRNLDLSLDIDDSYESVNEGFEWYQPLLALGGSVGLMATALFAIIGPSTLVSGSFMGGDSWGDVFRHYKKKFSDKKAAKNLKKEDVQELINLIQTNIDTSDLKFGVKRYMKGLMNELENEMNKDEEEIDKNKLLVLLRNVENYAKRNQVDVNEGGWKTQGHRKGWKVNPKPNQDQFKAAVKAYDKAESEGDIRGMELALAAMDLLKGESVNESDDSLKLPNSSIVSIEGDVITTQAGNKYKILTIKPNLKKKDLYVDMDFMKSSGDPSDGYVAKIDPNDSYGMSTAGLKKVVPYEDLGESVNEAKNIRIVLTGDEVNEVDFYEKHSRFFDGPNVEDYLIIPQGKNEIDCKPNKLKSCEAYLKKNNIEYKIQESVNEAKTESELKDAWREWNKKHPKDQIDWGEYREEHGEHLDEGIKDTIKRLFKAAKKKLGMSSLVQATDEEFEYARDHGLKKYPGYSMSGIGVDEIQDIIHVAYMDVDEDGDEIEIELPIPKNLNEDIVDDKAKIYWLQKLKSGEIDTLPDNPRMEYLRHAMRDQLAQDKEQLSRERGEMSDEEEHEHVKNLLKRNFMDEELTSLTPNEIGDESKQNTSASGAYESKEFNFKSMIKEALKYKHLR